MGAISGTAIPPTSYSESGAIGATTSRTAMPRTVVEKYTSAPRPELAATVLTVLLTASG